MRLWPLAALGCLLAAAGCGGSSGASAPSTTVADPPATTAMSAGSNGFEAPIQVKTQRAPSFALHDEHGQPVSLKSLRGKAVAITFVYTHCPDVCPLILGALQATAKSIGPEAKHFAPIAISVDPKGDRPAYVRTFLKERHLPAIRYLLGTRKQLLPVWSEYNVASRGDPAHPENIEHSALIYLVDTRGRLRLLYPAQPLDAKGLAHDVRLLARGS